MFYTYEVVSSDVSVSRYSENCVIIIVYVRHRHMALSHTHQIPCLKEKKQEHNLKSLPTNCKCSFHFDVNPSKLVMVI